MRPVLVAAAAVAVAVAVVSWLVSTIADDEVLQPCGPPPDPP